MRPAKRLISTLLAAALTPPLLFTAAEPAPESPTVTLARVVEPCSDCRVEKSWRAAKRDLSGMLISSQNGCGANLPVESRTRSGTILGLNRSNVYVLDSIDAISDFIAVTEQNREHFEGFFRENVMIAVFVPYNSSSYDMQISSLTRRGGEIRINAEVAFQWPENLDVNFRYVLIDVGRSELAGVTRFSLHETSAEITPQQPVFPEELRPMMIAGKIDAPKEEDGEITISFYSSPVLGAGCGRKSGWHGISSADGVSRAYILRSLEELNFFRAAAECHDDCNDTSYYVLAEVDKEAVLGIDLLVERTARQNIIISEDNHD
jgi:hypothetical protein